MIQLLVWDECESPNRRDTVSWYILSHVLMEYFSMISSLRDTCLEGVGVDIWFENLCSLQEEWLRVWCDGDDNGVHRKETDVKWRVYTQGKGWDQVLCYLLTIARTECDSRPLGPRGHPSSNQDYHWVHVSVSLPQQTMVLRLVCESMIVFPKIYTISHIKDEVIHNFNLIWENYTDSELGWDSTFWRGWVGERRTCRPITTTTSSFDTELERKTEGIP